MSDTAPPGHRGPRYIVGYRATPDGADALELGVRLARTRGAHLDVVVVLNDQRPSLAPVDGGYGRYLVEAARGWLREALERVPAGVSAEGHVVSAESFEEGLLDAAEELDAGLIVIGAAREGLLGRFTLGSVGRALLHSANVPVALAPLGLAEDAQRAGQPVERITAAIGTRPGAGRLLGTAVTFAAATALPLRLVSLVAIDLPDGSDDAEARALAAEHAASVLARAAEHLPADRQVTAEVAEGSSIEEAVEELEWLPGEVLLVGSSRLARPNRLFLGSVAGKIARALPVPMIVVPRDSVMTEEERHVS